MYDISITGGGLAGLSSAIQLSKAGLNVLLIEKKTYPFHRVCGEYISMETLPFLQKHLDFNPFEHGAAHINQLNVSSPKGTVIDLPLELGGFGLSRYTMDLVLRDIALKNGVTILEKTNVLNILKKETHFSIETNKGVFQSKMAIGTFGKRSNLDRTLERKSFYNRSPYIGVKHHVRIKDFMPDNQIALHNFKDGYCGMSRVEDDIFCLCYLSHRKNIKEAGNVPQLEERILKKNPFLNQVFNEAEFIWDKPLVINEISFDRKSLIDQDIWLSGDSAGMITPLCGNGMAMALHGSFLLSNAVISIFKNNIPTEIAFKNYQQNWQKQFSTRLTVGRNIQKMFGNEVLSEVLVGSLKRLPFLAKGLIKLTHGQSFV